MGGTRRHGGEGLPHDTIRLNFTGSAGQSFGAFVTRGMTLAIEPMINLGTEKVRILPDKWTAVTADGQPSAHFEHTVLVTDHQPEVLTWPPKTLSK